MSRAFDHEPKRFNEVLLRFEQGGVEEVKKVALDTEPRVSQKKPLTHEELLAEMDKIGKTLPPQEKQQMILPNGVVPVTPSHVNLRRKTPAEIQREKDEAFPENLTPESLAAWMAHQERQLEEYRARLKQDADRKAHREWRRDQIRRGVKFP